MPSELSLRRPSEGDAAAIAAICNDITQELYGEADVNAEEVRTWFRMPGLQMFVAEHDGDIVGYGDVRRDDEGSRFPIDLRIPLAARGSGVAGALLTAIEDWSRANAKPGAVLRGYAPERDSELTETYEQAGYRLIRHSFQMLIELPDELESPEWPDGISVRTFDRERDEQAVYECTEEAFADHWDFHPTPLERWRHFQFEHADFDPTLWWLAEDGGELAGACLNAWHFSGDRTFGFVGTLAVRRPWRRRGLGLALLRHSFGDFKQRGATRVGLGVDAENTTGAVRLYERAGMRPVRRSDAYEKPL